MNPKRLQPIGMRLVVFLAIPILISACAGPAARVGVNVLEPAKSSDATRLKRIAVVQFERKDRHDITSEVEAVLAGVEVNDRRYFNVVERQQLNSVLAEMKLNESRLFDQSTVSRLGKMLGANGVYMGKVTRAAWTDQRSNESRSVCAQREIKRDKKGRTSEGGCASWRDAVAYCTTRTANFEFLPRLVSVETGTIVYSRPHQGEAKSKSCREPATGASAPIPDGEQMLAEAKKIALDSFRRDIAPTQTVRVLDVLGPGEQIQSPQMKEQFNNAVAFAKEQRLDRACEIWQEIAQSERASAELTYNLGMCLETKGDIEGALALYKRADRLLSQPNRTINTALSRIQADQAARTKLSTQTR